MLKDRVLSSLIGAPFILLAVWFGKGFFSVFLLAVAIMASSEVINLLFKQGFAPHRVFVYLGSAWFIIFPTLFGEQGITYALIALVIAVALTMVLPDERRLVNGATTAFGALYVGFMLSRLMMLRMEPWGFSFTLVVFLATWSADIAAYFVGSKWGRTPLAPSVSPKKTWEGMIAGLFVAGITSTALLPALPGSFLLESWHPTLWGIVIGISALLGDLFESMMKRKAGVKDSGGLIPGHGGILDRFDAVLFSGVAGFFLYRLLYG